MKIDYEYLKNILDIPIRKESSTFDLNDFAGLYDENNEIELHKLIFHLEILSDEGLIKRADNEVGIGMLRTGDDIYFQIMPLRLTVGGHEFAVALTKPGFLESIADTIKEAGPREAVKLIMAIASKYVDKKIGQLISN